MSPDAIYSVLVVIFVLVVLATNRIPPDAVLMGSVAVLLVGGILTPAEAFGGFSNTGVMTIAVLYVIAAGLKETGAIQYIAKWLLGQPKSAREGIGRLLLPTSSLSAVMNNTAVVAMLIPAVQDWAQRNQISASKLLLPLSYITILGGTITLIGTSTNLVVAGLLSDAKDINLGMFDLAWLGLPLLFVGGTYLFLFGPWLLSDRRGVIEQLEMAREYAVDVHVAKDSPLAGVTIAKAGLRSLSYTYLAEIERRGQLVADVSPETQLEVGDTLRFIGAPEGAKELRNIKGLQPAQKDVDKLKISSHQRHLVEAVLGPDFPSLGKTIRESAFRSHYKAVILSVSRHGSRLPGKLGDIRFQVGDTLLLEAGQKFVEQYAFRRFFLLVSLLNDSTPTNFQKAPLALGWLAMLVFLSTFNFLTILESSLVAVAGMLGTRCISVSRGRGAIDFSVLIVIASSFALGVALTKTGAASSIAGLLIGGDSTNMAPWLALAVVYLLTVFFTELITNNAAAVLMFPIAMAVADQLGLSFMPFVIAVMFAASASFMTPLGYQTNLMVFGPGGYRWSDYIKLGAPLSAICAAVAITLIPYIWPF